MLNNDIGPMISAIRAVKRLSQKELAEMSDVAESYISSFETGTRKPSTYHIEKLEAALCIRFDDIRPLFVEFREAVGCEVQDHE